jgi:hypothetical protein
MIHNIRNFAYNGFTGNLTGGSAPYTATFKEWTEDPGIALMECSDGKERRVPAWAIEGFKAADYPKQDTSAARAIAEKNLIHLGAPSNS